MGGSGEELEKHSHGALYSTRMRPQKYYQYAGDIITLDKGREPKSCHSESQVVSQIDEGGANQKKLVARGRNTALVLIREGVVSKTELRGERRKANAEDLKKVLKHMGRKNRAGNAGRRASGELSKGTKGKGTPPARTS